MTTYFRTASVLLLMLLILALVPFVVQAHEADDDVAIDLNSEDVVEATLTLENTVLDEETEEVLEDSDEVLDEIEELEDLDIEEPTKIPSSFGFWWRNVREQISLAVTRDDVKKAEKQVRFAEERSKLAVYIVENSTDEKVQEKAQQMLEKADQYIQKVEERKEKFLEKADARVEKLLNNIAKHHVNKERVFDKFEDKLSPEKLEEFQEFRDKIEERHEKFLGDLENNPKVSEKVRAQVLKASIQVKEKRELREQVREDQKNLLEQIKQGNEEAKILFQESRLERNEKVRELQESFKAERAEILEQVKSGDKEAVTKLRELNKDKAIERKAIQKEYVESFGEIKQEAREKVREVKEKILEKKEDKKEKVEAKENE